VKNDGYITNLPVDATVEVPVYADREGFHPFTVGALPSQLAALNQSNVTVQGLAADAGIFGDPELAFWAIAMDPLTSAVLTLKEIREMVSEMFEAQTKWLPQFEGKKLKSVPDIFVPADTVPAPVPIDPALAINARFGKLGE
jgi:alpha-galactosidase